ncbi:MAG TPA: hypothetical protein VHT91_01550 [Kofleriaceae bacterium]|nr:hypothetical protein [Kofleriaceae bacterium]
MNSTARNSTQALIAAIEGNVSGIAVVRYPDLGLRDWTIKEVEGLAGADTQPLRTSSVDEAIRNPHRLVLLVPHDERAVVEDLDGSRDRLLDPPRTQPVILFWLRDGDGSDALAKAPSLLSWVLGTREVDPDKLAEVNVPADRAQFEAETGQSVEDWLADWRTGRIPRDGVSFARAYWAALLEQP